MTLSRAAIVGPYDGPTLKVKWPAFNDPTNLKRWADGPRVQAIGSELMEGLSFGTNARQYRAELQYTRQGAPHTLVTLKGPDEALLKKQLSLVAAYADLRTDRSLEIVEQMGYPIAFWSSVVGLTAHRHGKTLQLLEVAFNLAASVTQRFKFIFSTTRPVEFSPQIQPMIPTPGHGAWPSGHSTEAFLAATLLQALLDAGSPTTARHPGNGVASREQLQRLAARIAINRTVAGVHYPVDSAAGRLLGTALAEFIVARATGGKVHARGFNSALFQEPDGAPKDFSLNDPMDHASGYPYTRDPRARAVGEAPLLNWLWEEAVKEWP
ncbi:MAG: phosphatase PAP2 family protein [Hydrogenophaga sp.]|uniref:phosphatase PAP2 family protein n=1 Tax=Hydrogenophaga sp. TaxID=1904254 RepID=UPI001697DE46|nr:phosphatase PAP2 family protein [Hydrogenophaga sp.]NIM42110.1 phosphatase PAP2 family protein [Hydrogenophaga sp.]NIN27405.1 phosphatase PAP2 family protein [Hydrogenophaga sp.]NIN32106.1 phosphatase PAP2 family protein [Hydrogenophaga sp.]NIN56264.1 phosphatase PAP2 family protein [Hydrogenophaga sp.]NIO52487.1 phosphatase PAP2 family protein [Hydrogenophaga sp.]